MIEEIRNISSTKKDLQGFATVMAIACAVIGGIMLWRDKNHWQILLICSAAFLFFRFTFPIVLIPLQKVWMTLAVMMGWVVSRIILSILYFVVFTAIGLGGRIFGMRFLELKPDSQADSYWIKREQKPVDPASYEKQF